MTKFYLSLSRYLTVLLILATSVAMAQNRTVTGKVTASDDGSSLPGVNIQEKGTQNGAATDSDGNFSISVGPNAVLVFSFVGFVPQEINVGSQSVVNVSMASDVTSLSEIVVIGYGTVEKKDLTGSVLSIDTKDFNRGVVGSPQDMLVGKLAGVSITSSSGAPGAGSTIRIRGGSSATASNDPLIVIDGFPVDNATPAGVANPLASLNPNDIESYTVLKDASATAIYGARASNGVIIITTKKGKAGKLQIALNSTVGMSSPIKYFDVMSAKEYRKKVDELAVAGISGLNPTIAETLGTSNTDWQKEIFRNAFTFDNNLSFSGTAKNIPYRVSVGRTDQQGILENTKMERNSLNVNLSPTFLDDHLKVTLSAKASQVKNNFGEQGAIGNAITFDPTRPIKDPASPYGGYWSWINEGASSGTANPVAQVEQTNNVSTSDRFIGNAQIEYKLHFFPDLKVNVNAGMDRINSDGYNKAPITAEFARNASGVPVGRNNTYWAKSQSELLDLYLAYNKELGDHKFDVTAGYGWQHFFRDNYSVNKFATGGVISEGRNPTKGENFLLSFFGRVNYSYKGKYLITATLREDGSSRFADHWGLFPSAAISWKIKEESFLQNVNAISDLKLRLSYGQTGQQDVGDNWYPYLPVYRESTSTAQYQFGNTFYPTFRPDAYDASFRWETTETYNVGVDFGFFDDKLTGSVDVYTRNSYDLINYVPIANGSNFSNYLTTNIGDLTNKGIEIALRGTPIATQNFSWNAGFNFTHNVNEVTKLLLVNDPNYTGIYSGNVGVGAFVQNTQVGYPLNSFYVFQQVYGSNGKPVEGLYVDRSGDGGTVIQNESNKYHHHSPNAKITMGLNSRFNYKKFDFSFSGRISLGNYVYNNSLGSRAFYNNAYVLQHFRNMPTAITDTDFISQQTYSDYFVQDASFFKMDNMSLGYSLESIGASKLKARFSLTVQNAFIITKYDGMDPEVDGGLDNNIYPRPRVFLLGINLTY